ncbi:TNF receptor-associated factor 6-A-like [Oculina patagonica]
MAEGGNVPELGGYDYEFTSRVPDDWECLVCHLTMKDPVQIVGCGHRLCNICMESLFRRPSPTCPADRQPLSREKIFPDAACHRKILDLTVKCPHFGCSWTGELRAVEKHQSECPFKVVKCPNSGCTEKLTKQALQGHMENECSWRKINCEYCQESFILNQKQKHFDICGKFPVQCSNKCGLRNIPREKLDVHVRDECPATEVQCEYKNLGCKAVFPRSNVKFHLESQVERHLNLALRGLEATQLQVSELVSLVKQQSQQIERQSQQIERQSQETQQLMSKIKEQSQQIERQSQQIERLMERNEHINKTAFEWKIPNFEAIYGRPLSSKQTIVSEPFYLGGYRYKLKLNVSLFYFLLDITVVPGDFDSILSWPCKEKVRVTLIDQDPRMDNRENISHVIDFEKGERPCCSPHADDAHEYRFIFNRRKETLRTRSYIKNDTIFIMANKDKRD